MTRLAQPSGHLPPVTATVAGRELDLVALARAASDRFYAEFPDERERTGGVGEQWCRHDNQWVFLWAAGEVAGTIDAAAQARWLARVLDGRGYPVSRLARSLALAAGVAREEVPEVGDELAAALERAAAAVGA